MELKNRALIIIILLVGVSLFSGAFSTVGNPYFPPDTSVGGIWTNNTFVQMPCADVQIRIDYLGQSIYDVEIAGEYTLLANVTQQCTLGFAYPSSWIDGLIFCPEDLFHISLDDSPISTWPIEFENSSWISPWGYEKMLEITCEPLFVGFNVSFQADVKHTLKVNSAFTQITDDVEYFDVSYICGTAVSFMGSTRETITIVVNDSVPLSYIGFIPSTNLTVTNESEYTVAAWDLVYPAEYWPVYDPVESVHAVLKPFENETLSTTPNVTITTTPEETPKDTPQDILGPIAISGVVGSILCVATIVIWKSKKL